MRVLIAARLSKKTDDGQTGIDSQDLRMREWAMGQGHDVVDVVADYVSGRKAPWHRPNLRVWVTDPGHMVGYDAVAAYALDRLTRGNDAETAEIEAWARDNGKQLLVYSGKLRYPAEGNDRIAWDVAKRVAHQEWLSTSERTHRGLAYLRQNNFLTGALPFGFVRIERDGHTVVEPDPRMIPVIRELAARYMAGASGRMLCEWINGQRHFTTTGRPWTPRTMTRFLHNPILRGRAVNGRGQTILRVAPIFTDAEHAALVARMAEVIKPGATRRTDTDMLLGVVFCSKCGGIMRGRRIVATRADGTKRVNRYYRCDGTAMNPSGCRNMVRADAIEATVDRWFTTEDFSKADHIERTVIPGDSYQDELNANATDMAELLTAQDKLAADVFMACLGQLRAARDEIKGRAPAPNFVAETPTGMSIRQYWATLDAGAKRRYLLDAGYWIYAARGAQTYMTYDAKRVVQPGSLRVPSVPPLSLAPAPAPHADHS